MVLESDIIYPSMKQHTDMSERSDGVSNYEVLHDILVRLFQEILDIERKALITSEFTDISVNDMHIIEAIGEKETKNLSTVAKSVSVTVGPLSIAINSLANQEYVR